MAESATSASRASNSKKSPDGAVVAPVTALRGVEERGTEQAVVRPTVGGRPRAHGVCLHPSRVCVPAAAAIAPCACIPTVEVQRDSSPSAA